MTTKENSSTNNDHEQDEQGEHEAKCPPTVPHVPVTLPTPRGLLWTSWLLGLLRKDQQWVK